MHKKTERDIRTKTPTVHSNNPRTLNEFAKQLFLVTHEDKPHNGILRQSFVSFFLFFTSISSSHERIINRQILEKALNEIEDKTLLLSPLTRFTRFTHSMEFLRRISLILESARRSSGSMDRMNWIEIDAIFARTDRGTKRDWCRLSGTRLISSLSSPRMLIFLPLLPPRFSSFFVRSLYTDTSISCERETSI